MKERTSAYRSWAASEQEAQEYYKWYESTFAERLRSLATLFQASGAQGALDFSPASLELLAAWLKKNAEFRAPSLTEIEMYQLSTPQWLHNTLTEPVLTDFWEMRIPDVGAYLGEVFKRAYPSLVWRLSSAKKGNANFGQAVLVSPLGTEIPVVAMAGSLMKSLRNSDDPASRILSGFRYWSHLLENQRID